MHAFLEKWGLINFNVAPEFKPQRHSLLKETSYQKVLVNATNKHHLTKNETEYINNLQDAPSESTAVADDDFRPLLDRMSLRNLNLLTAK